MLHRSPGRARGATARRVTASGFGGGFRRRRGRGLRCSRAARLRTGLQRRRDLRRDVDRLVAIQHAFAQHQIVVLTLARTSALPAAASAAACRALRCGAGSGLRRIRSACARARADRRADPFRSCDARFPPSRRHRAAASLLCPSDPFVCATISRWRGANSSCSACIAPFAWGASSSSRGTLTTAIFIAPGRAERRKQRQARSQNNPIALKRAMFDGPRINVEQQINRVASVYMVVAARRGDKRRAIIYTL